MQGGCKTTQIKQKKNQVRKNKNITAWFEGKILRKGKGLFGSTAFLQFRLQDQQKVCVVQAQPWRRSEGARGHCLPSSAAGSAQSCLLPAPTGLGFASVYLACGCFLIQCHGFFKCANSCCSLLPTD